MPFDTIDRSFKRIRADILPHEEGLLDHSWSFHPTDPFELSSDYTPNNKLIKDPHVPLVQDRLFKAHTSSFDVDINAILPSSFVDGAAAPVTTAHPPIHINYPASETLAEFGDVSSAEDHMSPSSTMSWSVWDDGSENTSTVACTTPLHTPTSLIPPPSNSIGFPLESPPSVQSSLPDASGVADVLSKFKLSYTDFGLNMEARICNLSDLRSLVEAFSKLCCATSPNESQDTPSSCTNHAKGSHVVLYRNKNSKTKPVNFFASASRLGQILNPASKHGEMSLGQIADCCIDTYFTCWVRHTPILRKDEFLAWYRSHEAPTETLIVNAICSFVFRHMVTHHSQASFSHFLADQDRLQEQEEFFFDRARELLAQSFDTPDRFTVIALLFMGTRSESSRRHHYTGMAVSTLLELEIYPRMVGDEDDSFDKEMDTRLWWFAWATDFYLYSAGSPKNTPRTRTTKPIDFPRIFEQDIDYTEYGVLALTQCLRLWRIQADIISTLYEQESDMTADQLIEHDQQLLTYYESLPTYLHFKDNVSYTNQELFLACARVNLEYNATRVILHKLFIPEVNDSKPSVTSLKSLNVCLQTALTQLRLLSLCNHSSIARCAFDRDELWRAAEIVSMTMDICRTCTSPSDQAVIFDGVDRKEYDNGLVKTLEVLRETRDYQARSKNMLQVADWLEVEIRRHQLHSYNATSTAHASPAVQTTHTPSADTCSLPLKPRMSNQVREPMMGSSFLPPPFQRPPPPQQPQKESHNLTPSGSMLSVISFPTLRSPKKPSMPSLHFQNQFCDMSKSNSPSERGPMFSPSPPFIQFNTYTPSEPPRPAQEPRSNDSQPSSHHQKTQARFRYFNPRKMNKFLFIDEHPTL
ncbi:uncharacterized protein BYT42DRAFT_562231 [Radiomyces spectabilis]|uniref:uncharacterized protein n=1 Tax=Radiomyces spectabilis TaxID=64574 RepID=UPI00221FED76|nr:uncharacterized protein BYT42DRAFT_562231 [Radiomyces spectabilis]KAI8384358.1 hypothetical protein BYT42DRAFT_562231 [Radiomyces spectabilis]